MAPTCMCRSLPSHKFSCSYFAVCPNCSNALTIARTPATLEFPLGQNAFECRTCPYQFVLDKPYYERTVMKQKKIDDVIGATDLNSQSKTESKSMSLQIPTRAAKMHAQSNARIHNAILEKQLSINFKLEVQMNHRPVSTLCVYPVRNILIKTDVKSVYPVPKSMERRLIHPEMHP